MPATETAERWLAEDVGHRDVTSDVPDDTTERLVVKETAVAAGFDAAIAVFDSLGVEAGKAVATGGAVESGDEALWVDGDARNVLRGERAVANVAGHASGVVTVTRKAVTAARKVSDSARVAMIRETTPGLRGIEKYAVVAGGDDTHRLTPLGMAMVKDNHIAELGLEAAVRRFAERKSLVTKLEVEVEMPEVGGHAVAAGADIVLFNNPPPETAREGVSRLPEGVISEVSGDIMLEALPAYANTGVDVVSMGRFIHNIPSFDFSFRTG